MKIYFFVDREVGKEGVESVRMARYKTKFDRLSDNDMHGKLNKGWIDYSLR